MKIRKPIQITSSKTTEGNEILTALCDDGTIWQSEEPWKQESEWYLIKQIPQMEIEE